MESNNATKRTVLELIGLDKRWVWHKGQWMDEALVNQPKKVDIMEYEDEVSSSPSKKWFQFWKK